MMFLVEPEPEMPGIDRKNAPIPMKREAMRPLSAHVLAGKRPFPNWAVDTPTFS
jgi:hypothetical protein